MPTLQGSPLARVHHVILHKSLFHYCLASMVWTADYFAVIAKKMCLEKHYKGFKIIFSNRAFSLKWLALMQIYFNKKTFSKEKSSSTIGLVWNINMAAVSLF